MEKNIKEFVEHLPEKKDSKKIISLYTLIKKECPNARWIWAKSSRFWRINKRNTIN